MKLINRAIEDIRNNTMGTGERFSQRYFMHKGLKTFGQEGCDDIIKDMYQLDR